MFNHREHASINDGPCFVDQALQARLCSQPPHGDDTYADEPYDGARSEDHKGDDSRVPSRCPRPTRSSPGRCNGSRRSLATGRRQRPLRPSDADLFHAGRIGPRISPQCFAEIADDLAAGDRRRLLRPDSVCTREFIKKRRSNLSLASKCHRLAWIIHAAAAGPFDQNQPRWNGPQAQSSLYEQAAVNGDNKLRTSAGDARECRAGPPAHDPQGDQERRPKKGKLYSCGPDQAGRGIE